MRITQWTHPLKIAVFFAFYLMAYTPIWAADCIKAGEVCADGPGTKEVFGVPVYRECWNYRSTYQCRGSTVISDCQALRDKGCTQIGSKCVEELENGACAFYEQQYQCPDKPKVVKKITVCDSAFCQADGSGCFDTSYPNDEDFTKTAVMMEAARQAGVYGVEIGKVALFKGYDESCTIKVVGGATIKSCCRSSGGGGTFTNYALLSAGIAVGKEAGRQALKLGSKYLYDSLYGTVDSALVNKGLGAMNSWASGIGKGTFSPTFSYYGFSFQFSFANGFQMVGFNPYSFAAQIAIMLINEWLACGTDEQAMSLKRGQNLCVHYDTYCSKRIPGIRTCIEKKERHCCFNSKLAKLVNVQGKAQLGLGLEGCRGFTKEELERLDFSQMDLSEFIADIAPKGADLEKMKDAARQAVDKAKDRAEQKSYYE